MIVLQTGDCLDFKLYTRY